MANELVINVTSKEKRVAFLEQGSLVELYYDRDKETGFAGNIYKGKVQRVLPGMQAAFVEIGLEKAAFLYTGDVAKELADLDTIDEDEEGNLKTKRRSTRSEVSIDKKLKPGQELLVQIVRGPIGTKGARITSNISLPGRYLVYTPFWDKIGVSKRIEDDQDRRRLRKIIREHKGDRGGFIVRTASAGVPDEEIIRDLELLKDEWQAILEMARTTKAPNLVKTEIDVILKSLRDLLSIGIDKIVVDNEKVANKIRKFIDRYLAHWSGELKLYEDSMPIFDHHGIEGEIQRAIGAKVWLKSGGYLVIEQTEALSTIDVNTGRFVGNNNLEDTILKTNLEAVEEIGYQLRLRNMGGIIILDLIDMEKPSSRQKIIRRLQEVLTKDRTRTTMSKITELGLIEMTRKRSNESLARVLTDECPCCKGAGFIKSPITTCYQIFRHILREYHDSEYENLLLTVYPSVFGELEGQEHDGFAELQEKLGLTIDLKLDSSFHPEQFEVVPRLEANEH